MTFRSFFRSFRAVLVFAAIFAVAVGIYYSDPVVASTGRTATRVAEMTTVATGLHNPRGLNFAPDGSLYVAEAAGDGTASTDCGVMGDGSTKCSANTGSVTRIDLASGESTRVLTGLPSLISGDGNGSGGSGPQDVVFQGLGNGYVTIGLGGAPENREAYFGDAGAFYGRLVRFNPSGKLRFNEDLAGVFDEVLPAAKDVVVGKIGGLRRPRRLRPMVVHRDRLVALVDVEGAASFCPGQFRVGRPLRRRRGRTRRALRARRGGREGQDAGHHQGHAQDRRRRHQADDQGQALPSWQGQEQRAVPARQGQGPVRQGRREHDQEAHRRGAEDAREVHGRHGRQADGEPVPAARSDQEALQALHVEEGVPDRRAREGQGC